MALKLSLDEKRLVKIINNSIGTSKPILQLVRTTKKLEVMVTKNTADIAELKEITKQNSADIKGLEDNIQVLEDKLHLVSLDVKNIKSGINESAPLLKNLADRFEIQDQQKMLIQQNKDKVIC